MIKFGDNNLLKVLRMVPFGAYLDDGAAGILLPKRFLPDDVKEGDELEVFLYHDSDNKPIATTQRPLGKVGDIVKLKTVEVTPQGAFMDMGLMKDLFVPKSQQIQPMRKGGEYLVKIYIDELTGRMAATQRFEQELSNDELTVQELDPVQLTTLRRTPIGYVMIVNNRHTGVLHHNEIYRPITEGDRFSGFVKRVYDDNRIDVSAGTQGYKRVDDESGKILQLLQEHNGYLPYNDKSEPEAVYDFFGMSKKTFKMSIGKLYKERLIALEKTGIRLLTND